MTINTALIYQSFYPRTIPVVEIRKDLKTDKPVSRGRFKLLGKKRHTLRQYRELMQCAPSEPEIFGKGGALSLAQYMPLTADSVKLACAWLESECKMWSGCGAMVGKFEAGQYPKEHNDKKFLFGEPFVYTRLFRVMNGSLYYDWPWGIERPLLQKDMGESDEKDRMENHSRVALGDVVRSISDLPNTLFFVSQETHAFPSNVPFPSFSSSPRATASSDIPLPWKNAYFFERNRAAAGKLHTVSDDMKSSASGHFDLHNWEARIDKAVWVGSLHDHGSVSHHSVARNVVMNLATVHPNHIIANFSNCFMVTDINPLSAQTTTDCGEAWRDWKAWETANHIRDPSRVRLFGSASSTLQHRAHDYVQMIDYMVSFRYIVVLAGVVSADRLPTLLAHSGAVILLQETDFLYHFSARLQPWVHYGELVGG